MLPTNKNESNLQLVVALVVVVEDVALVALVGVVEDVALVVVVEDVALVVVVEDVALVVVVKTAQTLRRQMTILVLAVMRV